MKAVLEGTRPRTATARISADGKWIRCSHHGCHQALGTVWWGPYPAEEPDGAIASLHMAEPRGTVPYTVYLLQDGWDWRAGAWRADDGVLKRIQQKPRDQERIGYGKDPRVVVFSAQHIHGWSGAGQSRQPLHVYSGAGRRMYYQDPIKLFVDPDVDQLGYSLEQFPEMSQVVECAWCRSLVTVDLAAMSRELRPTTWKPGTKYFPV